jgi:protease I
MYKKILFVIAPRDFRDEEYLEPRKLFDAAGCEVVVASSVVGPVRGFHGTWVTADKAIPECHARDYDAVVFAGGRGVKVYFDDAGAQRLAREAVEHGKVLAAICSAPGILANAGVLQDVAATSWETERPLLVAKGAVLDTSKPVVRSGRIVTGEGAPVSSAFGREVLRTLGL